MAQVEFVGVMREIFSNWKIGIAVKPGETVEVARQRVLTTLRNSQPKITLQVRKASDIEVTFVQRR